MAYSFTAASSQYISADSAVVTEAPLTISAWASRYNATPNAYILASVSKYSASQSERFIVYRTDNKLLVRTAHAGTDVYSQSSNSITSSAPFHACGVFSAANNRKVVLNNTSATPDTSSVTPSGIDRTSIGADFLNSAAQFFYWGDLSEVAFWNVALLDDEITSLYKGFKPTRIRPQSLVFYAPLIRNLQDVRAGLALTNNNSATVADHPRVY